MARRGDLTKDELKIIKKKITDEEAFENFFRDCFLRNLRPATIEYYKNEFHAAKKFINMTLVECEQQDIENLIIESKNLIKVTTRLRALRSFYNYLYKNMLIERYSTGQFLFLFLLKIETVSVKIAPSGLVLYILVVVLIKSLVSAIPITNALGVVLFSLFPTS
ncbi:hypothetical protein [Peribacillus frigoritolerans]|uniref:hypothetical protein n=1 Tax=Peribacillus frigoritolerans TaxID=450367 RepID=UPI0020C0269D|nr:hypothetical protein [Peribacillus frigoritolerans]MEE3950603.1 hypothetical protein [Peribacillus frigoritolerans]